VNPLGYTDEELNDIYDKTDGYCYHCGKKLSWKNYGLSGERGAWEVDHSVPVSQGGTDYLRNLVPSCIECNRRKRDLSSRQFEYQYYY
jgi:5-methylcytosine-specific restriction endonuclease McrA